MRNMNQINVLKTYALSNYSVAKLRAIKQQLKEDINQADPLWKIITNKVEEPYIDEEEATDESNYDNNDVSKMPDCTQFPITQFYFTQCGTNLDNGVKQASIQKLDIVECLYEELEHPNGKLDLSQLENLLDNELEEIVCQLERKLTITGTYNLCCSMNYMTLKQRIKYATIFYNFVLLPKIIALEKPSRLLLSGITECVQKFPDDIQKFIFTPLLNVDLKDTSVIYTITNTLESQKNILLIEFLLHVKELKPWHITILHNLISTKTDSATNDKLVQLLSKKALDFAKDKDYGKFVLLFIKEKRNFGEQQKHLLWEIANVNQTLFKRPIQNILKII
ncbi:uncharacterized protein LOC143179810 [Calliopsis andreniformis]|uniref:uncharacterized protein LOC143179810 n=1 Tax=Calliopsis andreniformis TaxID=337506 RepID=UPI003FCC84AA